MTQINFSFKIKSQYYNICATYNFIKQKPMLSEQHIS